MASRRITRMLSFIKRQDKHRLFWYPVDRTIAPNYDQVVEHPVDLYSLQQAYQLGMFMNDISWYVFMILRMLQNAKLYNPKNHFVHQEACRIECLFLEELNRMIGYNKKMINTSTVEELGAVSSLISMNQDQNTTNQAVYGLLALKKN